MREPDLSSAALIGIDWGSSSLRAFLIGGKGLVLATRTSTSGASTLKGEAAFEAALQEVAGDWTAARPALPILACGMVGSQHGWREVPYADCPIHVSELALRLAPPDGHGIRIVPGLLYAPQDMAPDVMRGEETQIAGALQANPALAEHACIVMPGTHSKWAGVQRGRIVAFATHMTGELYAVLRTHSVLGRLMAAPKEGSDVQAGSPAFRAGIDTARNRNAPGLTHQLFTARTLPLTGRMGGEESCDYLSGLLIGHEIEAGLAWRDSAGLTDAPLVLIGEPELCRRYRFALDCFGKRADPLLPNTAPAGLWSLAHKAGLLAGTESAT